MKNLILFSLSMALALFGCSSNTNKAGQEKTEQSNAMEGQIFACPMHPEVTGKKGDKCSKCGMELTELVHGASHNHDEASHEETSVPIDSTRTSINSSFSIDEIVSNYLKMKNALTKDDSKATANAGKSMVAAFAKLDANGLSSEQKNAFNAVADDAKEHAEHIGDNTGKIGHQREHFAMLSKDILDLLNSFGVQQKLYHDHCPMYNDGKGAIWISETKEIKNPYYGSKMLSCGKLKKEL